jgi:hypothetical protein
MGSGRRRKRVGDNGCSLCSMRPHNSSIKEIVPRTERVALLFNPITTAPHQFFMPSIQAAAQSFAVISTPIRRSSYGAEKFPPPHVCPVAQEAGSCASNECFDRGWGHCNMRCWRMVDMGHERRPLRQAAACQFPLCPVSDPSPAATQHVAKGQQRTHALQHDQRKQYDRLAAVSLLPSGAIDQAAKAAAFRFLRHPSRTNPPRPA